jgi:hypothetical protein
MDFAETFCFKPFWNESIGVISPILWVAVDAVDIDMDHDISGQHMFSCEFLLISIKFE